MFTLYDRFNSHIEYVIAELPGISVMIPSVISYNFTFENTLEAFSFDIFFTVSYIYSRIS